MIKTYKTVFAAMMACGLAFSVTTASAQVKERTFRAATSNVSGNPQVDGLEKFAELVGQKSGGKMQVKVFTGAVLGKDIQVVSSMQGGTIDFATMNTNLLVGIAKEAGLVKKK